ncbi:MAG: glycosyltransferase family 4 protein [Crocinitomicaceae bacterium]|nr:glycosyltransferase family 4 protein [Crocinitomicaceae bacterium]
MIKIIQVIPNLRKGGAERLVLDICHALSKQKHIEVLLVTFSSENEYEFLTRSINWEVVNVQVKPSMSGKSISNVLELQAIIDLFKPNIVHSHLFESEIVLSEINYPNAAYFVHFHDAIPQFKKLQITEVTSKRRLTENYERKIVLKAYKNRTNVTALAISKDTFEYASSNLPSFVKVVLKHNAINTTRFAPSKRTDLTLNAVTIGSLVEKKGQILAIQTIEYLKSMNIEMKLHVLGNGSKREELETYSKTNGLSDNVIFHGIVDHPELFLANADIYLHTAIFEAFGLVLLEAMAVGAPVVCCDGKGNRDIVFNGENGFILKEREPEVLAQTIADLLENKDLKERIKINALKFSQKFSIETYADNLIKLYTQDAR